MKIILKENIENLGKRGDIIDVAPGYGRNYLLPKQLALRVTPSNMKMIELEQKAQRKKLEKERSSYKEIIDRLNGTVLTFSRKVGEKESLFGSVSISDIKDALDKAGFEIEKKKILLLDPIKKLGRQKIQIKVFHEDRADITIDVVEEGAVKTGEVESEKNPTPPAETVENKKVEEKEPVEPAEEAGGTEPIKIEVESPDSALGKKVQAGESQEIEDPEKPGDEGKNSSEDSPEK